MVKVGLTVAWNTGQTGTAFRIADKEIDKFLSFYPQVKFLFSHFCEIYIIFA